MCVCVCVCATAATLAVFRSLEVEGGGVKKGEGGGCTICGNFMSCSQLNCVRYPQRSSIWLNQRATRPTAFSLPTPTTTTLVGTNFTRVCSKKRNHEEKKV